MHLCADDQIAIPVYLENQFETIQFMFNQNKEMIYTEKQVGIAIQQRSFQKVFRRTGQMGGH